MISKINGHLNKEQIIAFGVHLQQNSLSTTNLKIQALFNLICSRVFFMSFG